MKIARFLAVAAAAAFVAVAQAQSWPQKPVRFIVPLPPGGAPAIALADAPHWEQTHPALRILHGGTPRSRDGAPVLCVAGAMTNRRVELTPELSAGRTSAAPCH